MNQMTAIQVNIFFSAVWNPEDIIEVRVIWPDRNAKKSPSSRWNTAGEWADGADAAWLDDMNTEGWNLYAGVLPRAAAGARGNVNTLPGAVLWADIDHVTAEEAEVRLEASGLPAPSIRINTGHGIQCYWLLTEKRQPADLRALVGDIAVLLKSDPAVKNEERVLRIPGFVNQKPPVADAELLECNDERCFEYDEIRAVVPAAIHKPAPAAPAPSYPVATFGRDDGTVERARRYLAEVPGSGLGGRTNTAFRIAAVLVRDYALDGATALDLLTRWDGAANMPPIQGDPQYPSDELSRIISNAMKYGKHGVGEFLDAPRPVDTFDVEAFITRTTPAEAAEPTEPEPADEPAPSDRISDPGLFPDSLLHVPGFVGELAEFINRKAVKRQPVLSLGAAIVALGTLAGRKVEGITGLRTNFYILGVAESGTGKDKPREMIRQLLYKSGNSHLYSSDRLKSDAGIRSALEVNPCTMFLLDEIGELLETIKNARHSPWLKNIMAELLMLYSSAASPNIKMGGLADTKRSVDVDCPHVCLFGTSVPKSLFRSMSMDSITGGFLGRIQIFESATGNPEKQVPHPGDFPDSVIEAARWWGEFKPNGALTGNHAGSVSRPLIVEEATAATRIFDDCERESRREIERLGMEWAGPFNRTEENARKFAIIYACSENREKPFIGAEAALWASSLSLYLTRRLVYLADTNVAENDTHDNFNKVRNIILNAGEKGLTQAELTRKTQWLKSHDRGSIVDSLVMSEYVVCEEIKTKTKPKYVFRATRQILQILQRNFNAQNTCNTS